MSDAKRKHPCHDCQHCQWCAEDRCRLCRSGAAASRRKLSFAEQISLYEQLNCNCTTTTCQDT